MPDDVVWPDQRPAAESESAPKEEKKSGGDATRTLIFAAITCVVASVLLAVSHESCKPRANANRLAFKQKNILKAFGVVKGEDGGAFSAPDIFNKHVVEVVLDADGKVIPDVTSESREYRSQLKKKTALPIYAWYDDKSKAGEGKPSSYVIPVSGPGLWGVVFGYLGLESDADTIKAISFYEHVETPGLGAEVEKPWFQDQFKGKKLRVPGTGEIADFKVRKGKKAEDLTDDIHAVGGIAAATITAEGVQNFIVSDMKLYEPYFRNQLASAEAENTPAP